ncbi:predicted protein [Nematostella vectensis]|uniref:Uncharacterized protein n=1 Tax=Nematostella vectensis TaxID=45351 RepID=A7SZB7_NEMVE|nr:uncharacterized protein LOC5501792 [Nematostella vectensis]EDO30948.1 predicted protein [Nematostella vectensis]|eukprot:XP_001623048.1 predicted protein [Nematostella vectensis]
MPQWVELPPNLVPCKNTKGKSIYQTDFSSKRPGFQVHLMKARGTGSSHHPRLPKEPSRSSMRASQTGDYMNFKEEYERSLAAATGKKISELHYKMPQSASSSTTGSAVYREVLSQYMKPSLEMVEKAWKGETSATKRDRDRTFGMSSKKVEIVPRPPQTEKTKKTPSRVLPGMSHWLNQSNEYEKAVVYNFMKHVTKATDKSSPPRPSTPQHGRRGSTQQSSQPKFVNELFYKQRAKSAHSQRPTDKLHLPPRPKTVASFRPEDFANESAEQTWAPKTEDHRNAHDRGHFDHVHHTDGTCDRCDYYRVKMLLEYLNRQEPGLGEATLRHLLRPRVDPPHEHPAYDYDYIHENSFFTNTSARDRGYFIIAPDWVSERKGIQPVKYRA